jgi:hypothetical protein
MTMLKLLRTVPAWRVSERSGSIEDLLGVFWGSGVLELFILGREGMRSWRCPELVPDVTRLRGAIDEGLRNLGCRPARSVVLVLNPDLVQLQLDLPAAATASVLQTLIQRSLHQQKPVAGLTVWRDVALIPSGDRARRLVYAMPEVLYRGIQDALWDLGIAMCSMVPFSGLAFLGERAASDRDVAVLDAWHLPCGIAVGLRRGSDLWMVRSLVLDPDDGRRISRELRQTLSFAREHWAVESPGIQLRGPVAWAASVAGSLRSEGVGNEVAGDPGETDWRHLVLRHAIGSCVDLVPAAQDAVRRRRTGQSQVQQWGVGVSLLGLLLSTLMVVEGYRIRTRTIALERERRGVERTLEDVEVWAFQREELATLASRWGDASSGVPVCDLATWMGSVLPDELVLTELDLWRTESVWHLAVSGRPGAPDDALAVESSEDWFARLEPHLISGIGVRPVPAMPKPSSPASANLPWAERLAGEQHPSGSGDAVRRYRKEWILP